MAAGIFMNLDKTLKVMDALYLFTLQKGFLSKAALIQPLCTQLDEEIISKHNDLQVQIVI